MNPPKELLWGLWEISTWSIMSGLFSREADQLFAHFPLFQRPPSTMQAKHLKFKVKFVQRHMFHLRGKMF